MKFVFRTTKLSFNNRLDSSLNLCHLCEYVAFNYLDGVVDFYTFLRVCREKLFWSSLETFLNVSSYYLTSVCYNQLHLT